MILFQGLHHCLGWKNIKVGIAHTKFCKVFHDYKSLDDSHTSNYIIYKEATEAALEARRTMREGGLHPNHILMTINRVMEADIKNHFALTSDCMQEDETLLAAHKIYRISLRKFLRHFGRNNHLVGQTFFRWGKNFAEDGDDLSALDKLDQAFAILQNIFCPNHISRHLCGHWLNHVKTRITKERLPLYHWVHGPGPESDEELKKYEHCYLTMENATRSIYGPAHPSMGTLYRFISAFYEDCSDNDWIGWEHASDKAEEYWTKFHTWQTIRKDKREMESSWERRREKFDFHGPLLTPLVPLVYRKPEHYRYDFFKKELQRIMETPLICLE